MKFGVGHAYWGTTWACDIKKYRAVAEKIAGMGFDMYEITADHLYRMTPEELAEMAAISRDYGLTLSTNSGPAKEFDFSSADSAVRANALEYFKQIVKNMSIVGSPTLAGAIYSYWPCDFVETDKEAAWERSIPMLRELGHYAEELGIECSLEILNRNETYILTETKEALEYCDQIGCKAVNVLIDTYHANIEEDDMLGAFRLAGDRLGHVHVGENNRKLPGMNNSIDWAGLGKTLKEINYQKGIVMEPFLLHGGEVGRDIRVWRDLSNGADAAQMDEYLKTSLEFLKKNFLG